MCLEILHVSEKSKFLVLTCRLSTMWVYIFSPTQTNPSIELALCLIAGFHSSRGYILPHTYQNLCTYCDYLRHFIQGNKPFNTQNLPVTQTIYHVYQSDNSFTYLALQTSYVSYVKIFILYKLLCRGTPPAILENFFMRSTNYWNIYID